MIGAAVLLVGLVITALRAMYRFDDMYICLQVFSPCPRIYRCRVHPCGGMAADARPHLEDFSSASVSPSLKRSGNFRNQTGFGAHAPPSYIIRLFRNWLRGEKRPPPPFVQTAYPARPASRAAPSAASPPARLSMRPPPPPVFPFSCTHHARRRAIVPAQIAHGLGTRGADAGTWAGSGPTRAVP